MGVLDAVMGVFSQPANQLSADEISRFHHLKQVVRDGIKGWHAAGKALCEIRDKQLFRQSFGTFEEFCVQEMALTPRRVSQLVDAATFLDRTAAEAPAATTTKAPSEQAVRELKALPEGERVAAYAEAVALESKAAGKLTPPKPSTVRAAVAARNAKAGRRTKPRPVTLRVPGASVTIRWNGKGDGDAAAALAAAAAQIAAKAAKAA